MTLREQTLTNEIQQTGFFKPINSQHETKQGQNHLKINKVDIKTSKWTRNKRQKKEIENNKSLWKKKNIFNMRAPFFQILPWTLLEKQRNILGFDIYCEILSLNMVDKRSVYWEIRTRMKKEQNRWIWCNY